MANPVFSFLDKVGGIITYCKNFVVNTIFLAILFIVTITIFTSCIVNTVQDTKYNKEKERKQYATVLTIDFGNTITDNIQSITPLEQFLNEINDETQDNSSLLEIKTTLEHLAKKTKTNIQAVLLDLRKLNSIRLDQAQALGNAINAVKKKGIKVYAYAPYFSQSVYALAAYADNIGIDPLGSVDISGISLKSLYFKGLLDNIALEIYTPKAGTHKSAVEPYNRTNMSPEVKKEYKGIIDDLWLQYQDSILNARKQITAQNFTNVFGGSSDFIPALKNAKGDLATLALNNKLIDVITPYKPFLQSIAKNHKSKVVYKKKTNTYNIKDAITLDEYIDNNSISFNDEPINNKTIAVVYGLGEITSNSSERYDFSTNNIMPQLNRIAENKKIGAVVLYLNTPGGEVYASEIIRRKLVEIKNSGRKIVVYISGMTASGGYWISTTADAIISSPSAITGSIGVFAITGSANKLLSNLGVNADGVDNSDMSNESIFLPINNKQKEVMQLTINKTYSDFVNLVSNARKLSYAETDSIAQGKIYTGITAKNINLIDKIGTFDDAIKTAAELMEYKDVPHIYYSQPKMDETMELINSFMVNAVSKVSKPAAIVLVNQMLKDPVVKHSVTASPHKAHSPMVYSYTPVELAY